MREGLEGNEGLFALAAIRLLIFTGARLGEILTLRWEYVDLEQRVLKLPDSKTGRKLIWLDPPAVEILTAMPRIKVILTSSSASARARILSIFRKCGAAFASAQIFRTCAFTTYDIPMRRSRWLPASVCS